MKQVIERLASVLRRGGNPLGLSMALLLAGCGLVGDSGGGPASPASAISSSELAVIAYYTGDGRDLDRYDFGKITHVIYSFVHLEGNQMAFPGPEAVDAYRRLVALKEEYPHLKVMFALGGWGGCETCSPVFADAGNRRAFAQSVVEALEEYGGDGIDLDWEYPAIEGHPGHPYSAEDRDNFTALVRELRRAFGERYLLSFAAGGFDRFLRTSIDWQRVMPLVNNVNLMSYDLVNGFSSVTGHHSPLYSTAAQKQSTDNAVRHLLAQGVPPEKVVIGAAFYSRVWEGVEKADNGRYQSGEHIAGFPFRKLAKIADENSGYELFWDESAQAPYAYNEREKRYATFDNRRSASLKTRYAAMHGLGGIMFWQLPGDSDKEGLVDAIYAEKTTE
ncbi:glycoside hydrolase family 18 protein [Microbulbifer halophilus]|uniref:chitinase n=1 Tax=Microbulbifer halophilus TaxID=453963 RepID=A0ABW5EB80_9GAMM|nr:glycoside hydrolase family 18 protein [Microbulbifer halophilus]MCW8125556.1 glycoside hydrolase family 18 protein [Microbulbifer halophilus]